VEPSRSLTVIVNGRTVTRAVPVRKNLVDFIRQDLELTGTHVGCEHGVCGACTVRLDGLTVRGCLILAVQADGSAVETIEGVEESGEIADLQAAFLEHNALQCGFCTPGMLLTAADLLNTGTRLARSELRDALSGNYCRCTGYQAIIDAIERVMTARGY
jgi:carbon-monoxide dehydrogenase small subunit